MEQIILLLLLLIAFISGFFFLWRLPLVTTEKLLKMSASVSVIIPARDEEQTLPKLLTSLAKQSLTIKEIIVIDDESTDKTADIARKYGARVLSTRDKKSSETGKSAACWFGAQHATGDYLVFMDADTECADSEAFGRILNNYQKNGDTGLFSIQPYHVIKSFYETFSIVPNIVVLSGLNRFTFLNSYLPKRGAFGPFLLVKAEEYFSLGGHEKTYYTHMDGIAMADLYQNENYPVTVYGGKDILHFRMYPEGLSQLVQGWTKSFIYGAKVTHSLVMASIVFWIMGSFLILAGLIDGLIQNNPTYIGLMLAFYVVYSLQFRWLMNKIGNFPLWTMFFSLIYISAFLGLYLWSTIQVYFLRKVKWRGREYKT